MEVWFLPREEMVLSFQLAKGSGWLTTHRLILCEHPPGHLEDQTPEFYNLEDFERAKIEGTTLTAHFREAKKATIQLPTDSPSILEEIKQYIEKTSQNWKKEKH